MSAPTSPPATYRLQRSDIEAVASAIPELESTIHELVGIVSKIAWRLEDPENNQFLETLGAAFNAGFASGALPWELTPEDSRLAQVSTLSQAAHLFGFLPEPLSEKEAVVIAKILGPLADHSPVIDISIPLGEPLESAIDNFVRDQWTVLPNLRALLLQSESALKGVALLMAQGDDEASHDPDDFAAKLKSRLFSEPQAESRAEKRLLDFIEAVIDRDVKRFIILKGGPVACDKKEALRTIAAIQKIHYKTILSFVFSMHAIVYAPPKGTRVNPLEQYLAFEQSLKSDAQVDEGLASFFRKAFVELVLHQPTLPGRKIHQDLRKMVEGVFREIRLVAQSLRRQTSTPVSKEDLPNREQRLKAYAENLKQMVHLARPSEALAKNAAEDIIPAPKPDSAVDLDPWDDLLDQARTIEAARNSAEAFLRPETPMRLSLRRSGFRYSVEFSSKLIAQLLGPEAGEPQDIREWLEAIQLGPARAEGQQGWKKRTVPIRGIYNWEIKIPNTPYRILGYKKYDGVWRFNLLERTHK